MNNRIVTLVSTAQRSIGSVRTFILTSLLMSGFSFANTTSQLTFLTWGDYIDEDVVAQFESEYNAKVNFVYFESDDDREEILTTYGPSGYDLMMVDSIAAPFYKKLGWIQEFDSSQAPNLRHVALPDIAGLSDREQVCSPYFWGTTGIAYRKDKVKDPIESWNQLFEPVPELQGKILMPISADELVGAALKYLGYSMNSNDKSQLEQARKALLKQAPMIDSYSHVVVDANKSKLVTGEVSALVTYNGDALMLKEVQPQIEYVLPKEGGAIWADFICLSTGSKNPDLAHKFIDFINRAEQAAANAMYVYGASPNHEAEKLLPSDFLQNPLIYPDVQRLEKSELSQPLALHTIRKHNSILNELIRLKKAQ
ncbi:spermidine/putrescine ABC transporter substrate-binding protein [Vibrio hannami]|uniref:ABC transporter substrate-binding protein n=1 Tax=Vibrio hannami TaxID=2717094 RepID=UPI00240F8F8E|nr:spermidine/putrescine ABC transporter substrate-binding protein [Vibrio hannami]MDG3086239.1 spermidine/putrescine ABC transporter substrate-binding protein [Vibrio hannami]